MAKLTLANGTTIEGTSLELAEMVVRFSTDADVVAHTFNEGDKVRVNNFGEFGGVAIGEIGTVGLSHADDDDAYSVKVEGDDDDHDYFRPQDLELVTEAEVVQAEVDAIEGKRAEVFTANGRKVNEYREGDIVQIVGHTSGENSIGDIGEVVEDSDDFVRIQVSGKSDYANMTRVKAVNPLVFVENRLDRK